MNRTDRLLTIVLELQRYQRSHRRAEDLAATFEVSKRTIYRDIEALCAAGVPIVALDRQGYTLAEGYFLPPLSFTTDQALMLALGSGFMATVFDNEYQTAAQAAYRKIDAALSPQLRDQVEHLRQGLQLVAPKRLTDDQLAMLRTLRQAIAERRRVRLHYSKRNMGSNTPIQSVREVDLGRLMRFADDWYLTGYCHLRQAFRVFKLTRIDHLAVLDQTFLSAEMEAEHQLDPRGLQPIFVQALFDQAVARWAREAQQYTIIDEEPTPEGVLITLLAGAEDQIARWLLSWGGDVRVLEPAWLQALLREHAARMLTNYSPTTPDD